MDRKSRLKLAAIVRVLICFPPTLNLFTFLKRRYSRSQVCELNSTCKWRGHRIRSIERILFLRKCLDNSVVPREIYEKVKLLRPRYAASVGRAFVKNEIIAEEEKVQCASNRFSRAWRRTGGFLSRFDWIRFNKLLGEIGCRLRRNVRAQYLKRLDWLRLKRFGSEKLNLSSVFNLSSLQLSRTHLEVLSRGPRFGIPPVHVCKEEVLAEFELYYNQLQPLVHSTSSEKCESLKVKLADLAYEYAEVKQDRSVFPLGKEHFTAIRELRHNDDIVITRPDKGAGTVLMDRAEYVAKMMDILNDSTKFELLGSCDEHDNTARNERALQAFLLGKVKQKRISVEVYNRIRPTGSIRPRMYGLPKVHKPDPIPLRPILSMVGCAQHEMARWLAEILQPVLFRFSSHLVKDSFEFCRVLQDFGPVREDSFMCSFDVKSLFTNVPIEETIGICLESLYHSDMQPPDIDENLLRTLLLKATRDVQFSFNNMMYRQTDGVAMGSPLGPVLANIFLGYCESQIPDELLPEIYRRFVDDTFSLFFKRSRAFELLECLNNLHPSLEFTMESQVDRKLPFLDVLVMNEGDKLNTTIFRKPTFTGLYTRWDSYCSTGQKIALVRSLTVRAKRICSPGQYLVDEVKQLKLIFERNGYPHPITDRVIDKVLNAGTPDVLTSNLPKPKAVYIRLPWLGKVSMSFKRRIFSVTKSAVPMCQPTCCFTSRQMFNTNRKDVLPAEKISNIIYLFTCDCGHRYVGKTTQRLEERVKQHVPEDLVQQVTQSAVTLRRRPGRPRKNGGEQDRDVETMASARSDTAITKHLKASQSCRLAVCTDYRSHFKIMARGRSKAHLNSLEAIFIACNKPELCVQKDFVKSVELFNWN